MRVPYVVGQWVRGASFYGRAREIDAILSGGRRAIWVAGTRRIGKSSLLRQLEHLGSAPGRGMVPLFWDLQGAVGDDELAASLEDAVLDAGERLAQAGIDAEALTGRALPEALDGLLRAARSRGRRLLLLVDEAEELLDLPPGEGALLELMPRLVAAEDATVVLASSVRLARLTELFCSSPPPLAAFAPPLYLAGLARDEAAALLTQSQLPEEERPHLDAATVAVAAERCGGHPYLLQLLAKRLCETGDLDAACETVAGERMLDHLFEADLALLEEDDRRVLVQADSHGPLDAADRGSTARLLGLGLLRPGEGGRVVVGSCFLESWLRGRQTP